MDKPNKRRKYDEALEAEALRVARESRSTQAAAVPYYSLQSALRVAKGQ
jgi:hypothetical protein